MKDRPNPIPRLLAPVALFLAAVVLIVVISSSGGGGGGSSRSHTRTGPSKQKTHKSNKTSPAKKTTYVVKPGDSLSVISQRTGVSVDLLNQLNPGVDPQALASGQCLKLSASGKC